MLWDCQLRGYWHSWHSWHVQSPKTCPFHVKFCQKEVQQQPNVYLRVTVCSYSPYAKTEDGGRLGNRSSTLKYLWDSTWQKEVTQESVVRIRQKRFFVPCGIRHGKKNHLSLVETCPFHVRSQLLSKRSNTTICCHGKKKRLSQKKEDSCGIVSCWIVDTVDTVETCPFHVNFWQKEVIQ